MNIKESFIKFDLDAALAGCRVKQKNGVKVLGVHLIPKEFRKGDTIDKPLIVLQENGVWYYMEDGRYDASGCNDDMTLVMHDYYGNYLMPLFDHMRNDHDLALLDEELQQILYVCNIITSNLRRGKEENIKQ